MKTTFYYLMIALFSFTFIEMNAQNRDLDNYRYPDKNGINVFEAPKDTVSTFEDVKIRIGGSSTLQFQNVSQENASDNLPELGGDFNLATANLDLDVALAKGLRMHLRTYLSSQHHHESYVKGGYLQIDNMDFIKEGFAENFMKYATIKIGHMENNYGDAHFRRTDNAQAMYNPFVGNYLMDSFTTEVGAELYYQRNGFLGMLGFTNGKLNQNVEGKDHTSPSILAKFGYDKQINEDFRFRLTGSMFKANHNNGRGVYLYSGDRAGSRYYNVMTDVDDNGDGFRGGRINPNLKNKMTAIMFNPFIKYGGLEFFGVVEFAKGKKKDETEDRKWNQVSGEVIYRFGKDENLYFGARYNTVSGELDTTDDVSVNRFQLSGGWFFTKNILLKAEYVTQTYNDYPVGDVHEDGKFNGFVAEAVISF